MGRVLRLGMEALGTSRSVRVDGKFKEKLDRLVADATSYGSPREKTHAKAVSYFAKGYALRQMTLLAAAITHAKIFQRHDERLRGVGEDPRRVPHRSHGAEVLARRLLLPRRLSWQAGQCCEGHKQMEAIHALLQVGRGLPHRV